MSHRRQPIALFAIIYATLAYAHQSFADTLAPILLNEDDRVCWRIYGSVNTIEDCLLRANSETQKFLDNRIAWIEEILKDRDIDISALYDSNKKWRNNKELTCDKLIWERDKEGSRRRTEPLRCHYFMTEDRYSVLDAIYALSTRNKFSVIRSRFGLGGGVCWNPYGWQHELDCLTEKRAVAIESLGSTIKLIFDPENTSPIEKSDRLLGDAQSAWESEVDVTCKKLVPLLQGIRNDDLEKEASVWCEFLMARSRERLFLRLYEFALHQKGISVRQ